MSVHSDVLPDTRADTPPASARRLWRDWVVANAIGWLIGIVAAFGFMGAFGLVSFPIPIYRSLLLSDLLFFLDGFILGALLGRAQCRALWRRIPGAAFRRRWRLASALAWAVGWSVFVWWIYFWENYTDRYGPIPSLTSALTYYAIFALIGTLVGVLQWFVLRSRMPGAAWWILVNAIGWPVGVLGGAGVGEVLRRISYLVPPGSSLGFDTGALYVGGILFIGLFQAAFTGLALARLLRQRPIQA